MRPIAIQSSVRIKDSVAIADHHEALLIVDEAHATDVYGEQGRGLTAPYEGRETLLVVHTCGKALGAAGALVTASGMRRFHGQSLPFVYSCHRAPSPLMAVAVPEALTILQEEPKRQRGLAKLVAYTHREMGARGLRGSADSQIVAHIVGHNAARCGSRPRCKLAAFDIRGIRPPTVPVGAARLRVSLTLNVGEADVRVMHDALFERRAVKSDDTRTMIRRFGIISTASPKLTQPPSILANVLNVPLCVNWDTFRRERVSSSGPDNVCVAPAISICHNG